MILDSLQSIRHALAKLAICISFAATHCREEDQRDPTFPNTMQRPGDKVQTQMQVGRKINPTLIVISWQLAQITDTL